jgi:hypothetical protein
VLKVLTELPADQQVVGSLIWVRVLEADTEQAAQLAASQMADPRLEQFYDPGLRAAREMAAVLDGSGSYAWDTYLVFPPGLEWREAPPKPSDWVHQLDHAAWAPAERRQIGEALVKAIRRMIVPSQ